MPISWDFFLFPNYDVHDTPIEYRLTVHVFGAVSSPSVANIVVRQTIVAAKDTVLNNFYVDDALRSVSNEIEALNLFNEVKALVARGGFYLTSVISYYNH